MQCKQHEEEEGKGKRVRRLKEREKQKQKQKRKEDGGMWGSWSRVRCIPQPSAVCSSIRTSIAHPIAQVHGAPVKEHSEFVSWLYSRGEEDSCHALTVGKSDHGRTLFATRPIQVGERVLRVSRNLMITPDKLPAEVTELLPPGVSEWARLALFILAEQHRGQASKWAPYIRCLPPYGDLHSTVFWKKEELDMLRFTSLHRETIQRKAVIGSEFASVLPVLQKCPHIFGERVLHSKFKQAYATVCSRAWGIEALQTLALVPFVDFFNHDSNCRALLSYDEEKACAEVTADKEYTSGDQVVISYGRLPNSILALDFGFTLSCNPHDQVEVWMALSHRDPLRKMKLALLHAHAMPTVLHADGSDSGGNGFQIREVKSVSGRGKGIPHALRAFARVLCASTPQELSEMAAEAMKHDGRLARQPAKSRSKEAQVMNLLLARFESLINQRSLAALQISDTCRGMKQTAWKPSASMAMDVIAGEIRVLRSAAAWLRHQNSSNSISVS
ncbi:hypothetical protein KC19_1G124000 [Ceratodon purpureus]|uniref:SET domain-containing protein n=1 Tax=Ceratodon purpureus TaxID=3225 RepID=A0A8T0J5E7_CERPU|nr:hypothetical protein KC19_1G124000 [Ceratodon purpureus]